MSTLKTEPAKATQSLKPSKLLLKPAGESSSSINKPIRKHRESIYGGFNIANLDEEFLEALQASTPSDEKLDIDEEETHSEDHVFDTEGLEQEFLQALQQSAPHDQKLPLNESDSPSSNSSYTSSLKSNASSSNIHSSGTWLWNIQCQRRVGLRGIFTALLGGWA